MAVTAEHITRTYGTQKALDDVSFNIDSGQVIGFLGPNGAGKSTMMKIISCFIPQTAGRVTVNGKDTLNDSLDVRRMVGYLPENNPLYYDMYVREFLQFIAAMQLPDRKVRKRVDEMIEMTGLLPERHKKIGALSKGYRQRVGLAQALMHDPPVLILDEPTTGLDPNQLVDIRKLIIELGKEKTVILSTHIMQEVEAICNRVLIINKGKIVADDSTSGLKAAREGQAALIVEFSNPETKESLLKIEAVKTAHPISDNTWKLSCSDTMKVRQQLLNYSIATNNTIVSLRNAENTLEEVFRELTGNKELPQG